MLTRVRYTHTNVVQPLNMPQLKAAWKMRLVLDSPLPYLSLDPIRGAGVTDDTPSRWRTAEAGFRAPPPSRYELVNWKRPAPRLRTP
ncbi:hypothetical protein NDU88_005194 [Pleurodeles waltl]|uniref:Uncharacterized protein n=1 Tax=Pleurodeles waltl TaxID=8319 RepID=A0AAV7L012_PLEWA|nr:hypothetical protein NDU88_005194 [Pleurodeles waltl]